MVHFEIHFQPKENLKRRKNLHFAVLRFINYHTGAKRSMNLDGRAPSLRERAGISLQKQYRDKEGGRRSASGVNGGRSYIGWL